MRSRMLPDLPMLFTSGYPQNAILHQGQLDDGFHLLAKPYRRQELADRIRKELGDNGGHDLRCRVGAKTSQ